MARVLLVFLDGCGVGPDSRSNPFLQARMPVWTQLCGRMPLLTGPPTGGGTGAFTLADATLGLPGLPQSATGQTALFTGHNAAALVGRHLSAYPTPSLARLIEAHSVCVRAVAQGLQATFANTFTAEYCDLVQARLLKHTASTLMALSAGLRLRDIHDLERGEAVYHDITGEALVERGYDLQPTAPAEAGKRLARLAAQHHFTYFEHFLTDAAGHAQDMDRAVALLERLDAFLGGLVEAMDARTQLLLISSDHGNVEDLSVSTHTTNPVPVIGYGREAPAAVGGVASITDVAGRIVAAWPRS